MARKRKKAKTAKRAKKMKQENRYKALIEKIFFDHYKSGATEFEFDRTELITNATALNIELPKNLGDAIYYFRYRMELPEKILKTQTAGRQWIIEGIGKSRYRFRLAKENRIVPSASRVTIKIPDATPELIASYAQNDEQALLAKVRYNRLVDIFLGVTTYSLQNHLRATVKSGAQIEIDELYVGIDKEGCHYVIPVQAKGGKDQVAVVQTQQDITWCAEKFPGIRCRAISAMFMSDDRIAMFELTLKKDDILVVDERHYQLVPADQLDEKEIKNYRP
jgi:hypothetical protein